MRRVPDFRRTRILETVVDHARVRRWMADDHFSVDGTLFAAWASMKNFRPTEERGGHGEPPAGDCNAERGFPGEKLSNETRASCTDPDARLTRRRIENGGVTVERPIGQERLAEVLSDVRRPRPD